MQIAKLIFQSILLGTVQGLTEFLPVSSSGHLALLQRLFGYPFGPRGMTFFSIMLHLGTLIAVVIAFRGDIRALFRRPFGRLAMLLAATLPAGIVGLTLGGYVDAFFAGPYGIPCIAAGFGVTAVLLLGCEYAASRKRGEKRLGWGQAAAMGMAQAVAVLPGISRSGSTIAAGVFAGGRVGEVSTFSFLMSVPVILGSALVGILGAVGEPALLGDLGPAAYIGIACGVAAAAVSGYLALRLMKRLVRRANYKWFALYLLVLACLSLWANALLA